MKIEKFKLRVCNISQPENIAHWGFSFLALNADVVAKIYTLGYDSLKLFQ